MYQNTLKRKHDLDDQTQNITKKIKTELVTPFLSLDTLILIAKNLDITSLVQVIQINKQWNELKKIANLWEKVYYNSLNMWGGAVLQSYWEDGSCHNEEFDEFILQGEPLYSGTGAYQELLLKDQIQITKGGTLYDSDRWENKSFLPFQLPISPALPPTEESTPSILDNYYFYPPTPHNLLTPQEKCQRLFQKHKSSMVQFAHEVLAWFDTEDMVFFLWQTLKAVLVPGKLVESLCRLFEKGEIWGRLVFFTMEAILLSRDVFSVIDEAEEPLENEEDLTIDEEFVCDQELWKQFGKFYVCLRRFSLPKIVQTYNILYHKYFKSHPHTMLGYSVLLCSDGSGEADHWSNHLGSVGSTSFEDNEELPLRIALSRAIQRSFFRSGIKKAEPDATEMGITVLRDFLKGLIGDAVKIHDLVTPQQDPHGKDITVHHILAALEIGGKHQGSYGPSQRLPHVLYGYGSALGGLSGTAEDDGGEFIPKTIEVPLPRKVDPPVGWTFRVDPIGMSEEKGDCPDDPNNSEPTPDSQGYDTDDEYEEEQKEVVRFLQGIGWTPENPAIEDQSLYGKLLEVSRKVHAKFHKPLFDPSSPEDLKANLPLFAKNWLLCTGKTEEWVPIRNGQLPSSDSLYLDEEKEEVILQQIAEEDMAYYGEILYDKQDRKVLTEEDRFREELRRRSREVLREHWERFRIESVLQKYFPDAPADVLSAFQQASLGEEVQSAQSEEGNNEDLVMEKETFRDMCFSVLRSVGTYEMENSAMNILQRAGEELIKQVMEEATAVSAHALNVLVSPKDICLARRLRR
eukprot:TRINITY_DN14022_c0_g2_i1.p1 TRINITY_DN14022_c0_g2~~TRINITY_DN14022_c0_g2_i1.p1  ORF type:complete len:807 (-),score=241.93 TRINITY_DN14022_c0_g2_i1:1144-3543(-)